MTCNRNILAALALSLCLPACAKSDDRPAGGDQVAAPKVNAATARTSVGAMPTLDQVLAKHFAALGGEGKLRAATTLTYSGTATSGDKRVKVAKYYKHGYKMRVDKDDGETKHVMVFDGARGWKRDGDELSELSAEKAAYFKEEADIDDALLTYEQDGRDVRLVGMVRVDGKPAYQIELVKGEGAAETRYIDAATYYEVKRVMTWKGEDGKPGSATAYFSDYRDVGDGMMVNHRADIERQDGKTTFIIESAAYNQPIDDAKFRLQPIM